MAVGTLMIWISLIVILLAAAGAIVLQVYLSGRESRIPGLLLPLLSFLYSLFLVFNLIITENMSAWSIIGLIAGTLAAGNLSTLLLLVIYFIRRDKIKQKKLLDKMNIQDL